MNIHMRGEGSLLDYLRRLDPFQWSDWQDRNAPAVEGWDCAEARRFGRLS